MSPAKVIGKSEYNLQRGYSESMIFLTMNDTVCPNRSEKIKINYWKIFKNKIKKYLKKLTSGSQKELF